MSSNFMPALTSRNGNSYQKLNLTSAEIATIEGIKQRAALRADILRASNDKSTVLPPATHLRPGSFLVQNPSSIKQYQTLADSAKISSSMRYGGSFLEKTKHKRFANLTQLIGGDQFKTL